MNRKNAFGFSLIEVMIALGICALLALLLAGTTGVNLLGPFIPGNLPSPQLKVLAERIGNTTCLRGGNPTELGICFIDKDKCISLVKGVALRCFITVKDGIPPLLTVQDEQYLQQITRDCYQKNLTKTLVSNKILLLPTCDPNKF